MIPKGLTVKGAVLTDHLESVDWQERGAEFICRARDALLDDVLDTVADLLEL